MPMPLKGGASRTADLNGAPSELHQGENAQSPTTQIVEEELLREWSGALTGDWDTAPNQLPIPSAGQMTSAREPLPGQTAPIRRELHTRKTSTTLGAAQKDTSRELAAKFANMKPVQFVGLALLLVAGALAYFKWWTPALIAGGGGLGLLVLAHSIVGNERLITIVLLIGLAIVITFRAYEKGQLDSVLPDALDKKKPPTP